MNDQEPLTEAMLRDTIKSLSSKEPPLHRGFTLHPFQAVDIYIRPKGWFSRLVWRWIQYSMDWGKDAPLKVHKGKP